MLGAVENIRLRLPGKPSEPFDPLRLALVLWRSSSDALFFSPGYNSPLFTRIPFVFTICDLNHIDIPENSTALKRLYYATVLKRACRKAKFILTISEFSRNRIAAWSAVPINKIVNVGCGVDPVYHHDIEPYMPGYPYFLIVSNRKPHKNERRIVDAFAVARLPREMRLVFTGNSTDRLKQQLSMGGISDRATFAGELTETELAAYYRGATALVFPSLYEGFGLPVVEAMACGTPVITSNRASLPEVAGNAALLIDPESVQEIADAMNRVTSDSILRANLRLKGIERAKKFTWEQTVRNVQAALEKASPKTEARSSDSVSK